MNGVDSVGQSLARRGRPTEHQKMMEASSRPGDPVRLLLLGIGQMGSAIARLVLDKQGLELVGAYGRSSEHIGVDLGAAIGLDRELGMPISADLDRTLKSTRPDIAIQATCSRIVDAAPEILTLVSQGVHVISIAEELAYPSWASPAIAKKLHGAAVANRASILGTGINPGFMLDFLVIALSGVCSTIQSISATRVNDLSPYGPSVLRSQGVGLSPEQFRAGIKTATVVGHIGFGASIHMIAHRVGWQIDRIAESREPIISRVARETPFVKVAPGQVAGCLHTALAYREGKPVIELIHPQQIHPELEETATGDLIEIFGTPHIRFAGSPEIPGGIGTTALAVNMIPQVINAPPGLHTMADLPAPAAMLGDARWLLRRGHGEESHG